MASVSSYIHHQVLLSEVEAVLLYFKCGYNMAPVYFFLMQFFKQGQCCGWFPS